MQFDVVWCPYVCGRRYQPLLLSKGTAQPRLSCTSTEGRGQVKHTAVHSMERWRLNSPHAATPIAHFERPAGSAAFIGMQEAIGRRAG